ncbi:unnamed protein product [Kluyveromyces dobzhanskii CBS 2104]|uniref:WGS project CCBQ000000000 data, contig 00058 n=1 Tax=Kluyveromyces dobzhanskii CBS 2104 TaxID=1427455 RepID=A0A0A8LDA9_9SACH|nr:unnamed protein product [Kluyveromyces dobzhanskii CBS 2104]
MKCSALLLSLALALESVHAKCNKKSVESSHKGKKEFNLTREYAAEVARGVVKHGDLLHVASLKNGETPVSFPEYYVASDLCEGVNSTGNPILVLMNVSSTLRNYEDNGKLSITVGDRRPGHHVYTSPRANLFGSLKKLETSDALRDCYGKRHPDAIPWLPGHESVVHDGAFYEFEVENLYYVGGFGFQAYIGDIDGELYHEVEPKKLKWGKRPHGPHGGPDEGPHDGPDEGSRDGPHDGPHEEEKDFKKHGKGSKKHGKGGNKSHTKEQENGKKEHAGDQKKPCRGTKNPDDVKEVDSKPHNKDETKHGKDERKHGKDGKKDAKKHDNDEDKHGEQHPFSDDDSSKPLNEKVAFEDAWESAKSMFLELINNY